MTDPKKLREQARKLIEKANRIEEEKAIRIGRCILKAAEKDFQNFTIEDIRKEVAHV